MTAADLPAVCAIADRVHVKYREDDTDLRRTPLDLSSRLRCLRTRKNARKIRRDASPRFSPITPDLNVMLGDIPARPKRIPPLHDIALSSEDRGSGAGSAIVGALHRACRSDRHAEPALVAVNNSMSVLDQLRVRSRQRALARK